MMPEAELNTAKAILLGMEESEGGDSFPAPGDNGRNGTPPEHSQTASEFIESQLQLEADAREVLPYSFDDCTYDLGPLKQTLFSCLTCNPISSSTGIAHKPAGVCYSCSIACHGEHELVELGYRRNFTCDCGTTRFSADQPCRLRNSPQTETKGSVHSQPASAQNTYNQNFGNRFCGCGELYDHAKQKVTMFQCIGLANEEQGGCSEDWWHPQCLTGLPRVCRKSEVDGVTNDSLKDEDTKTNGHKGDGEDAGRKEDRNENAPGGDQETNEESEDLPLPPGFPEDEEDINTVICYKCVQAIPALKPYANHSGFSKVDFQGATSTQNSEDQKTKNHRSGETNGTAHLNVPSKKRKADDTESDAGSSTSKKAKVGDTNPSPAQTLESSPCKLETLPPPPKGTFSLIAKGEEFRSAFCRCRNCYPSFKSYQQLLEEEEAYDPPVSEGDNADGEGSIGSRSLLERGEAALSTMDRVRGIEGAMVYNKIRDKVKSFLQPFAESGEVVSAEDVKAYFAKLRGDDEAMKNARSLAAYDGNGPETDHRREQGGY